MPRTKALAAILVFVVLPVVVLGVRLTLPSPVPESWEQKMRAFIACAQPYAVYRDPEPCDAVWGRPSEDHNIRVYHALKDEERRRVKALLEYLEAERKLHTE
jgi:hypothetical protein